MATTKLWSVHSEVADVANYDINPLKTTYDEDIMPRGVPVADVTIEPEHGLLVSGINCNPKTAVEEFMEVKRKFEKPGGVLAYHGYISFPNVDGLDPVEVLSVAKEMAHEMWGDQFQVLLSVHTNTKTLHCHLLVNSVSFVDGHKAVHNEKNYYRFKNIVDSVCRKYDLTVPVPNTRVPLDYPGLEEKLVNIRMKSPDIPSLKNNLEAEGIKYCGKNYIRVKDGRFVRLSMINADLANLFEYAKPDKETIHDVPSTEHRLGTRQKKDVDRVIGRS